MPLSGAVVLQASKEIRLYSVNAGSDTSSREPSAVKPLSASNTQSDNVVTMSATQTVKQPFSTAGAWNMTAGLQFGTAVTLSSSQSGSACHWNVIGGFQSECLAVSTQSADTGVQSAASNALVSTVVISSQHSDSKHAVAADAAQATVTSSASCAAKTGSRADVSVVRSSCSNVVSTSAFSLAAAQHGSRKSVDVSRSSLDVAVVSTTCALLTSHTSSVFSTLSQQASSLFSFGQAPLPANSSKPLGVPSASTSQFKAQLCSGL